MVLLDWQVVFWAKEWGVSMVHCLVLERTYKRVMYKCRAENWGSFRRLSYCYNMILIMDYYTHQHCLY